MKNNIITLVLFLLFLTGFSQNTKYQYFGRLTPSIKKEKLTKALFINEIMPEFSRYFQLPHDDRFQFDVQLKATDSPQGYFINTPENSNPKKDHEKIINYVSIEIFATCEGKTLRSQSANKTISTEQKNILNSTDLGTDIRIKIKFKFKYPLYDKVDTGVKEGEYSVTVVPETEAEYPGGSKKLTDYLIENVFNKIHDKKNTEKVHGAIVKFNINEEGQVVDVKMLRTSKEPKTDKLIIDAINRMPKWKPAKNAKGINIKQEFSIPFGNSGC